MKYVVRVGDKYFSDGLIDDLRVVVMELKQAQNLVKILQGDEQDIEIVEYKGIQ